MFFLGVNFRRGDRSFQYYQAIPKLILGSVILWSKVFLYGKETLSVVPHILETPYFYPKYLVLVSYYLNMSNILVVFFDQPFHSRNYFQLLWIPENEQMEVR